MPEEYQDYLEDFRELGGFDFLRSIEDRYECGGICYEPLFYLTQDINMGRPTKECFSEVLDEVVPLITLYSAICGGILLLSFIVSLFICGGVPKNEENSQQTEKRDFDDPGNELGTNPAKPGAMY